MTQLQTRPSDLLPDPGVPMQGNSLVSNAELALAAEKLPKSPTIDILGAAYQSWTPTLIGNDLGRPAFAPDPNFRMTEDVWAGLTDGIAPDLWPRYLNAQSHDEAKWILGENRTQMENRDTLARGGVTGWAAQLAFGIADPVPFLATAGVATGIGVALKSATAIGRLGSIAASGATMGLTNAAIAKYAQSQGLPIRDSDVLSQGLAGASMGAVGPLTASLGRVPRFLAGGIAASAPGAMIDAATDRDARDAWSAAATNFILGGAFAAAHKNAVEKALQFELDLGETSRTAINDIKVQDLQEISRTTGETLRPTAKDTTVYNAQLDEGATLRRAEATVGDVVRGIREEMTALGYDTQEQRSFSQNVVPLDSIAAMSRRQFKQRDIPGFAATNDRSLVARLTSEGTIEVGDAFFRLPKESRLAAINDAQQGGFADTNEALFLQAVEHWIDTKNGGVINASQLQKEFGTITSYEQAKVVADKVRAIRAYRANRGETVQQQSSGIDTYQNAVREVAKSGIATTEGLQRALNIDAPQASALIDKMIADGLVTDGKYRTINVRQLKQFEADAANAATQQTTTHPVEIVSAATTPESIIGTKSVAAESAPAAESVKTKPTITVAAKPKPEPKPIPEPARRGAFSATDIENQILKSNEKFGDLSVEFNNIARDEFGDSRIFTFEGELPAEVKTFIEKRREMRGIFRVAKPGDRAVAQGADAMSRMGEDAYFAEAERLAKRKIDLAKENLLRYGDPQDKFLVALHDNLPPPGERQGLPPKQITQADAIAAGKKFTINGEPFVVIEDEFGMRVLKDGGSYPEVPLEALDQIPVDKGSLKNATDQEIADAKTPARNPHQDLLDYEATDASGGMGAASQNTISKPVTLEPKKWYDLDFSLAPKDPSKASFTHYINVGGKRINFNLFGTFGMAEYLGSSDSPTMRQAARYFGVDRLPDVSGNKATYSAAQWAQERTATVSEEAARTILDGYNAYLKRTKNAKGTKSFEDFRKDVTQAKWRIADPSKFSTYEPEVQGVAKELVKVTNELLRTMRAHGVPAADRVPYDDSYMATVPLGPTLDQWRLNEPETLRALFYEYARGNDFGLDNDPRTRNAIAQAFMDHFGASHNDPYQAGRIVTDPYVLYERLKAQGPEFNDPRVLDALKRTMRSSEADKLASILRARWGAQGQKIDEVLSVASDLDFRTNYVKPELERRGWNGQDLTDAMDAVGRAASDRGNPSAMKRKFHGNIDAEVPTKNGGTLKFTDLVVTDSLELAALMARRAFGASALHEGLRAMTPDTSIPPKTIPEFLSQMRAALKNDGLQADQIDKEIKLLDFMVKHTAGIPNWEHTGWNRTMRTLRSSQSALRMPNIRVGLQNGLEVNKTFARYGLDVAMKQMPAIKELADLIASGKAPTRTLMELHTLTGQGSDWFNKRMQLETLDPNGRVASTAIERGAQRAAYYSGNISGTNMATQVAIDLTAAMIRQSLVDSAKSGRMPSKKRLALGSLDESDWQRVMGSLKNELANGTIEMAGGRVEALNMDKWSDQQAAMLLRNFVSTETRGLIQRGDETELSRWMTHPTGKIVTQFRDWGLVATRNHLWGGVSAGDLTAAREFVTASAFGALMHLAAVAEIYAARKLGGGDETELDKFLKDKLSAAGVAKGAFARSSWSNLMPAYWDAAAALAGRPTTFSYVRSAGPSDAGGLASNPTFNTIDSASRFLLQTPQSVLGDRQLSQKDVQDFTNAFVPNIFGLKEGLKAYLSNGLPKTPKVSQ